MGTNTKNKKIMNTTMMKNRLLEKFSAAAISQTVYLQTKRTTDIDEMTDQELTELYLLFFPKESTLSEQLINAKNLELLKKNKANVLTIATRIGIKEPDCWLRFNKWMLNSSKFKKRLNDYNLQELKELQLQLRAASANYEKSSLKVGTKAWYHKYKITPPSEN